MKGQTYIINREGNVEHRDDNQPTMTSWYTCRLYVIKHDNKHSFTTRLPFIPCRDLEVSTDGYTFQVLRCRWDLEESFFDCEVIITGTPQIVTEDVVVEDLDHICEESLDDVAE